MSTSLEELRVQTDVYNEVNVPFSNHLPFMKGPIRADTRASAFRARRAGHLLVAAQFQSSTFYSEPHHFASALVAESLVQHVPTCASGRSARLRMGFSFEFSVVQPGRSIGVHAVGKAGRVLEGASCFTFQEGLQS